VDAYGEEEQVGGFFTMMEEHLALPFSANFLGVDVVVEVLPLAQRILSERIPVLRFPGNRPRADKS
jgi:hypothetical protein